MRCPNCNSRFTHESELFTQRSEHAASTPWYKLAPPGRVVCPHCGIGLRYNRVILAIVALLGAGFLASMGLKMLFPQNTIVDWSFWFFMVGLFVSVPLILHSNMRFVRKDS